MLANSTKKGDRPLQCYGNLPHYNAKMGAWGQDYQLSRRTVHDCNVCINDYLELY